ncbi:hypothetical protein [Paenibacillus eucommiae]|uniref:Uncharacterized protein n=1 Tax=Paenibacillus eucommiae TaxID=1355755 RepID=A0ABS4J2L4_9BACL|nr:hypothetical protein [Paenibacillus eucommiae]MBP1994086.1 hypothetical protein [Paenibacillus eucommiae]
MIFIVKVRMWSGPRLLTMKNIVKIAAPLGCARWQGRSSIPAAWPAGKSPPIQRKTLAGSPFELGARVIRAITIIAEKGMGVGGRAVASAFKDWFLPPHPSHSGNKSLTAAGAHIHSLRNAPTP